MQNTAQTIENLVSELKANGLIFELSGQGSLRVQGKATKNQVETIRTHKTAIIEVLAKDFDNLRENKSGKFHEILNRLIEAGIKFEVSADNFRIIDAEQISNASDKEFLKLNYPAILCELQQSLLVKHLFNNSPEYLEDFWFEVLERESIISETFETIVEIYCDATTQTTRKWFDELF